MPKQSTKSRLEDAIQEAAQRFAMDLMEVIRSATVNELAQLQGLQAAPAAAPPAAPKRRGRPPKKKVAEAAEAPVAAPAPAAAEPVKKPRKKRVWPTCTAPGCKKNVYMPSGALKMCYQHYQEKGGKPSPLVAYAKDKKKKNQAAKAAAKKGTARKPAARKPAAKKPAARKTSKKK